MILVRGSNTGVRINGNFLSQYNESCPRIVVLRGRGIQAHENDKDENPVFALGRDFERYYKEIHLAGAAFEEEKLCEHQITDDVLFQGHCDIFVDGMVLELKSLTSKTAYGEVFKRGRPKPSNLFQLCAYMLALNVDKGKLIYGSYLNCVDYQELKDMNPADVMVRIKDFTPELREFNVDFDSDTGDILVNKKPSGFNVMMIDDFWQEIARLHKVEVLPPKPAPIKSGNPCYFCPFREVCSQPHLSLQEFEKNLLQANLASAK